MTSSLLRSRCANARSNRCLLIVSWSFLSPSVDTGTRSFEGDCCSVPSRSFASRRPVWRFKRTWRPGGIAWPRRDDQNYCQIDRRIFIPSLTICHSFVGINSSKFFTKLSKNSSALHQRKHGFLCSLTFWWWWSDRNRLKWSTSNSENDY